MKILLVSATEHELDLLKLTNNNSATETDILISGIGIAATTFCVTKKLMQKKYDVVIQAGIAGSFTNNQNLGDVIFINADTFGDLGIEETGMFKSLFSSGLTEKNDFPFTEGWLVNTHELLNNGLLKTVNAITVNKITDDKKQIEHQRKIFNAQVESMEGAAFHYVCLYMKIPFLQIRSISNVVGERDKSKWKMRKAIDNLNDELSNILRLLSNKN
jgi:futalosine hydrolase